MLESHLNATKSMSEWTQTMRLATDKHIPVRNVTKLCEETAVKPANLLECLQNPLLRNTPHMNILLGYQKDTFLQAKQSKSSNMPMMFKAVDVISKANYQEFCSAFYCTISIF